MTPSCWRGSRGKRLVSLIAFFLSAAALTFSQTEPGDDPDRQRAIELYHDGKTVEAMPLFENSASLIQATQQCVNCGESQRSALRKPLPIPISERRLALGPGRS